MNYEYPLIDATLIRRYKRFLADVELPNGEVVVAHCPNSGSMKGCWEENAPCRVSHHDNPKRKLKYTLEQVQMSGQWLMVHTGKPNAVVAEAIESGTIPELRGYGQLRREQKYGSQNSRIDILLENPGGDEEGPRCYVEVKSVTLKENGLAMFPDSVTKRGTKHLEELMEMVVEGHRGVLFFHVSRADCDTVRPADHIDPVYGATLRRAAASGVEILAYVCAVEHTSLHLMHRIPVVLDAG